MNATLRVGLVCAALSLATIAWAKTYTMQTTTLEPGAVAKLDVKANTGNTELALKAEHLAKPSLLSQPATNYVVWIEEEGRAPPERGRVAGGRRPEGRGQGDYHSHSLHGSCHGGRRRKNPNTSDRVVLKANVQQ